MEGLQLEGGWTVLEKLLPVEGMTGSNFSIGYTAKRNDGREGFVKVLDISRASMALDPARTLQALTTAFNFERDILNKCKHMSKIVSALTDGTIRESKNDHEEVVQYIILELAESDLRKKILLSENFDQSLKLRIIHNVAVGLSQLHSRQIAHQDLKPSNVLVFDSGLAKVGDLGRSTQFGNPGPHDEVNVAGDLVYSPPEYLYKYISPDWDERRKGCDLYQLGSLVVYEFTGLGVTRSIEDFIHEPHRSSNWSGTYSEVLPYIQESFRLMVEKISDYFPASMSEDLTTVVSQLCNPDPSKRGHPRNHAAHNPFGLERYISLFNRLAVKTEIEMRKNLK